MIPIVYLRRGNHAGTHRTAVAHDHRRERKAFRPLLAATTRRGSA